MAGQLPATEWPHGFTRPMTLIHKNQLGPITVAAMQRPRADCHPCHCFGTHREPKADC